jgi:predicted MFS family arabinose efflux permease
MSDRSVRRVLLFLLGLLALGAAVVCALADHQFVASVALFWAFGLFCYSVKSEDPE